MSLHSYKSRFYPKVRNAFRIRQEYAMRHYGWLTLLLFLVLLYLINYSKEFVLVGIFGGIISFGIANVLAGVSMRRHYAEAFFVNEQFCILSVYDLVYDQSQQAFPVLYGSPQRTQEGIQLNYHDQVVILRDADWPQIQEIWQRFWITQPNNPLNTGYNETLDSDSL